MQSRLSTIWTSYQWVLSAAQKQQRFEPFFVAAASIGRTADPAFHSGEVEAGPDDVHTGKPHGKVTESEPVTHQTARQKSPHVTSPRLENAGLNQPNPVVQQKRQKATSSSIKVVEEVSCAGLDGTPWPEGKEKEERDKNQKVEDDNEYFKRHKASPLSEMEMADTRKPITRATDGTADAGSSYGAGRDVIGWRPEQLDTAEEALRRAAEIWRQSAMRGDPETFPHSRVLRELRGEWF